MLYLCHDCLSWLFMLTSNCTPLEFLLFIFQCKNVISKLQRRIDKEGCLLVPMLYGLWKKNDSSNPASKFSKKGNSFNLRSIDQRVESLQYAEVADFIADVQSMLKNVVQFYKHSREVWHFPFTSFFQEVYNN